MKHQMQALLILACDRHEAAITRLLDECGIGDWVVLPTAQARRQGFLQYVPPRHVHGNYAIMAFAASRVIKQALHMFGEEVRQGEFCPDCTAYVWDAQQIQLSRAALDPVCEKVVNRDQAIQQAYTAVQGETTFYFCSPECRAIFIDHPEPYLQWKHDHHRLGQRELASSDRAKE